MLFGFGGVCVSGIGGGLPDFDGGLDWWFCAPNHPLKSLGVFDIVSFSSSVIV